MTCHKRTRPLPSVAQFLSDCGPLSYDAYLDWCFAHGTKASSCRIFTQVAKATK